MVRSVLIGAIALGSVMAFSSPSGAQTAALIRLPINEGQRVTLSGNTRPEATPVNDAGLVADNFSMPHMLLQLKRSDEQQQQLEQLAGQLADPSSVNYHQFLTAAQFAAIYGPNPDDLRTITGWLQSHGFQVNTVYPTAIDFSGAAGQVREAFGTSIHRLIVNGQSHIANMSDPQIPAALAPAVVGPVALNDFRPRPTVAPKSNLTRSLAEHDVVPGDLYTIYNFTPLFNAGITGKGQTIALMSVSDLYSAADWTTFRSTFKLNAAPFLNAATLQTIHPNNCAHSVNGADGEAILDVSYSSAAAPDATILLASCNNLDSALVGTLQLPAPPDVISISYAECESYLGAAGNAFFDNAYLQAAVQGISVFVAAGDWDAAVCNAGAPSHSTLGISVNGLASPRWNVAVGGTDFEDTYLKQVANYWYPTNSSTYSSAKSYIPEIPWNDSCASALIASFEGYARTYGSSGFCNSGKDFIEIFGGSGGPSGCATGAPATPGEVNGTCAGWPRPDYQNLVSIPGAPTVRVLPDVSLFAANGIWGHAFVFCFSSPPSECVGTPASGGWGEAGGTSFSSPIFAGIQALINQKAGGRQGWVNPIYYRLAAIQSDLLRYCNSLETGGPLSGCIFHDVTQGDNDAVCEPGTPNCYAPSGMYGVLSTSTSSYQPAYKAGTGWDFATGLGTPNVANLVLSWPGLGSGTLSAGNLAP